MQIIINILYICNIIHNIFFLYYLHIDYEEGIDN